MTTRTLHVTWHPDAIRGAIDRAVAITSTTDSDQPCVIPWIDLACLIDMGRAWITDQEEPPLLPQPDEHDPDRWHCQAGTVEAEHPTGAGDGTVWFRDQPIDPDDARELAYSLLACADLVDPNRDGNTTTMDDRPPPAVLGAECCP